MAHAPLSVMGATALAVGSTMLTALVSFVVARQVPRLMLQPAMADRDDRRRRVPATLHGRA